MVPRKLWRWNFDAIFSHFFKIYQVDTAVMHWAFILPFIILLLQVLRIKNGHELLPLRGPYGNYDCDGMQRLHNPFDPPHYEHAKTHFLYRGKLYEWLRKMMNTQFVYKLYFFAKAMRWVYQCTTRQATDNNNNTSFTLLILWTEEHSLPINKVPMLSLCIVIQGCYLTCSD